MNVNIVIVATGTKADFKIILRSSFCSGINCTYPGEMRSRVIKIRSVSHCYAAFYLSFNPGRAHLSWMRFMMLSTVSQHKTRAKYHWLNVDASISGCGLKRLKNNFMVRKMMLQRHSNNKVCEVSQYNLQAVTCYQRPVLKASSVQSATAGLHLNHPLAYSQEPHWTAAMTRTHNNVTTQLQS